MQMSNTNICASQMRTADAQLCEAPSGMLILNRQTHPKAAILYTCIENGEEEGIQLVGKPLFSNNTSALTLKDDALTPLFKDPVRTAL
jgi:hypothetical protein